MDSVFKQPNMWQLPLWGSLPSSAVTWKSPSPPIHVPYIYTGSSTGILLSKRLRITFRRKPVMSAWVKALAGVMPNDMKCATLTRIQNMFIKHQGKASRLLDAGKDYNSHHDEDATIVHVELPWTLHNFCLPFIDLCINAVLFPLLQCSSSRVWRSPRPHSPAVQTLWWVNILNVTRVWKIISPLIYTSNDDINVFTCTEPIGAL